MNGRVPSEGRVEICFNSVWGTIADDFWDVRDARVVCSQLGYSSRCKLNIIDKEVYVFLLLLDALPVSNAGFGQNTQIPILLDNVFCRGTETRLVNCTFDTNTQEDNHSEDAGVQCFQENGTTTLHYNHITLTSS